MIIFFRLPRVYGSVIEEEDKIIMEDAKETSVHDQNMYLLDKFYSLSAAVAKALLHSKGNLRDFPFRMSQEEYILMQKKSSLLLIGRSGTGGIKYPEIPQNSPTK